MNKKHFTKSVVIGRFQPMHNGHLSMIKHALSISHQVNIVIGSSWCYPNINNPFTLAQRIDMIKSAIWHNIPEFKFARDADVAKRIKFSGVRDYRYNDERWKLEVRQSIDETDDDSVVMVGFDKDKDSYWLHEFGWKFEAVPPVMGRDEKPLSATNIRYDFLSGAKLDQYGEDLPSGVFSWLQYYKHVDQVNGYKRLQSEYALWQNELAKFESYPYKDALNCCTADTVVVCNNHLLVIERKFAPGMGAYALPGGHKESSETFKECAIRELREEVKLKVPERVILGSIKESKLFDHPKRSCVFSKPTVAQYIVLQPNPDGSLPRVMAASDAKRAFWMPMHQVVSNADKFFDDHYEIVINFLGL